MIQHVALVAISITLKNILTERVTGADSGQSRCPINIESNTDSCPMSDALIDISVLIGRGDSIQPVDTLSID